MENATPDPRLAIIGYTSGNCTAKDAKGKGRLKLAPYVVKPYVFDSKTSIGPGPSKQVVVIGFDPFTPESQLKVFFSSYGEVATVQIQTDPDTASYLGICIIRYRDSRAIKGVTTSAASAAKTAEKEANGQRLGTKTIRVERDREGRKCKKYVDHALKRSRDKIMAEKRQLKVVTSIPKDKHSVTSAGLLDTSIPSAPPVNAPKGPSVRSARPIETPQLPTTPILSPATPIIQPLVLSYIKRKPYILIPETSVPIMGTIIPHLQKRLKSYPWTDIKCDQTGYYILFEDSKHGEEETVRCYRSCKGQLLFTYTMDMICQQYGNPDYERSPTPERVISETRHQREIDRLQKEEDDDLEIEKKHRAEVLDPVEGALDQLRQELCNKILEDIKSRIAQPLLHDYLDPTMHAAKRRKLNLPDESEIELKSPSLLLSKASMASTANSQRNRRFPNTSKPLRPHDTHHSRRALREADIYGVERRERRLAAKAVRPRPLSDRLIAMDSDHEDDEEESDDERRSSQTRDTEDIESRPLSSTSRTSSPIDAESLSQVPKPRKRKLEKGTGRADQAMDDAEDPIIVESFEPVHKNLLGDLLYKDPEDLATRELELVINTLPWTSALQCSAREELYRRKRARHDDELFKVKTEGAPSAEASTPTESVGTAELLLHGVDPMAIDLKHGSLLKKQKVRRRRRTKKEMLLERQAQQLAKLEADTKDVSVDDSVAEDLVDSDDCIEEDYIDPELGSRVEWGVSTDEPRRTVEDEENLVLDTDGWQHLVKDVEDLRLLTDALADVTEAPIADSKLWAWRQKEIKALNNGGIVGPANSELQIAGYYVANPTGSARTEGVKKIFESEKSLYLPHRIKVQKAREEREAKARRDPAGAVEQAKAQAAAKQSSIANSRSNRANNRRLVNDINLQKQGVSTSGTETDAFRFNQLKKRKKPVRFDRSAIHGWGLYSEENIQAGDLIIEYVGEKIRQKVADMREIRYTKQGIGSSYLFRMAEDEIIDATKKGGIARFINHSCAPNCTAKIIKVEGTRRIVIYALKDITQGICISFFRSLSFIFLTSY